MLCLTSAVGSVVAQGITRFCSAQDASLRRAWHGFVRPSKQPAWLQAQVLSSAAETAGLYPPKKDRVVKRRLAVATCC